MKRNNNSIWGFIRKEFFHIFRDRKTLLLIFGMPVAQLLLFGFVVTNEIKDAKIAVYDQSKDYLSLQLVNKLVSSGYFILSDNLSNASQIDEVLKAGKAQLVVSIQPNFAAEFQKQGVASVQLNADASEPNTASILTAYASAIISDFAAENSGMPQQTLVSVQSRMLYNPELKSVFMFVPGTMALILMLITAMMTSISIAREKEMGTMEVLLVSPLKPWQIVLGKVFPYIGLGFANALLIIILGYFVFMLPLRGSMVLLLLVTLLFIILALSLGILISTVSKTQQVAMFLSMFALLLPTILLSGFIFPIENMPVPLQWLSLIMPPRWFISALKTIMIKGEGLAFVYKEILVMLGMTIAFLSLSIKKFKIRL